jgi:hypothetical protein
MEWIPALSPTRRNVQTTTKSLVGKTRPRQNRVPDQHVACKIIGGYGVDSRSLPNSKKLPNHDKSFQLSPHLKDTSKPGQNHLLIKEGLGRTEYLIDTWVTN